MRLTIVNLSCLLMMLIGLRASATAQDFIGVVKPIEGSAVIQRSETTIPVANGMEIQFEPLEKKLFFVLRMIQGTVSFLSGQVAKLSPESVKLVMPAATIGVRGTHVLIKVD